MSNPNTGWTLPDRSRKWHFIGEDGRSLCGKWLYLSCGGLEQGNDGSADNCAECKRKRLASLPTESEGR